MSPTNLALVKHPMQPEDVFRLPMPGITSPLRLTADSPGYTAEGLCLRCQEPWELHRDSTGNFDVGCDGACLRRRFGWLRNDPSGTLHAEDLFPALTQTVLGALQVDCGAQMAWAANAVFTPSELLIIARRIANTVVGRIKQLEEGGK